MPYKGMDDALARQQEWFPRTMEESLKLLELFLTGGAYREQERLYNVLSALRGPDTGSSVLKHSTTSLIRQRALGNGLAGFCIIACRDTEEMAEYRRGQSRHENTREEPDHFLHHARSAFEALGISWAENNDPIPEEGGR